MTSDSQLGHQLIAAAVERAPGDGFVGRGVDDEDDVVAVLEVAGEDARRFEVDLEAMRAAGVDAGADVAELGEEDALVRAGNLESVLVGLEGTIADDFDGFALPVEEERADGAGGRGDERLQNVPEHHSHMTRNFRASAASAESGEALMTPSRYAFEVPAEPARCAQTPNRSIAPTESGWRSRYVLYARPAACRSPRRSCRTPE